VPNLSFLASKLLEEIEVTMEGWHSPTLNVHIAKLYCNEKSYSTFASLTEENNYG